MSALYLLGIDIGTSSSKGVIMDTGGEIKALELIEHGVSIPKPGWAEHDAEEVWWGDFCRLLPRLTAKAKISAGEITGIGTGDVGAEAISAGVFAPGETILVYGSTMSYLQCLAKPVAHAGLFSGLYIFPCTYFIGGATAAAGALTKWFRDNFAPLEKAVEKRRESTPTACSVRRRASLSIPPA